MCYPTVLGLGLGLLLGQKQVEGLAPSLLAAVVLVQAQWFEDSVQAASVR